MLYAVLICSDETCAQEVEAWGEPKDFEQLACEGLRLDAPALSLDEAAPAGVVHLHRRTPAFALRRAA